MSANKDIQSWNGVPSEIRLLLYEVTLRFERPIKKLLIKWRTKIDRKGQIVLLPIRSRFAILFVNKEAFAEGLPMLYQNNTISITHQVFHNLASPARGLELGNIRHLKLRLDSCPADTWMRCSYCFVGKYPYPGPSFGSVQCAGKGVINMLSRFGDSCFAALRTVVVAYGVNWSNTFPKVDLAHLRATGLELRASKVGQLRVLGTREGLEVDFVHEALADAWETAAAIVEPDAEVDKRLHAWYSAYLSVSELPFRFKEEICMILLAHRASKASPDGTLGMATMTPSGVRIEWLKEENQTAEMLEAITTCLEQFE